MANRHDVIIWDADVYPVENDYHQAVRKVFALSRQNKTPSNVLVAFANTLNSRSDDEDLEPAVVRYLQQVKARLIASNTAALMLPLPEYEPHWRSVLDILIEETTGFRLALCDEYLGLVFLPGGTTLSLRPLTNTQLPVIESKDKKDFPVSLNQFDRLVKTKIGALLNEHGFILIKEVEAEDDFGVTYDKAFNMGKLSVTISYHGGGGEFKLGIRFTIIEDNMIAIAQKSDFKYPMMGGGGVPLNIINGVLKLKEKPRINNWEKFEELLSVLRESVLRWSDAIKDIKDIDALLNGDIDEAVKNDVYSYLYTPYALIAARLAGNPNFEELAVRLGAHGPDSGRGWGMFESNVAIAWPKLVNYLREEVKPLVYLADSSILPTSFQINEPQTVIDPEDTKNFPITVEQFHTVLKIKLNGLLITHDFVLTQETTTGDYFSVVYDKAIKRGKLSLSLSYNNFEPNINFTIIEDNMIAVAQKIDFSHLVKWEGGVLLNINGARTLREQPCINNWKKFEGLLSLLRKSILQWSDAVEDIKGIDALLNSGAIEQAFKYGSYSYTDLGYLYAPYALIAARLAGNANFEELARHLAPYGSGRSMIRSDSYSDVALAWPKLVNYLREAVKPLVDWPEGAILPNHVQGSEPQPIIDSEHIRGFPISVRQFYDLSETTVDELLIEHGFVLIEKSLTNDSFSCIYEKTINGGMLRLSMGFQGLGGDFKANINFQIIEDNMIAIAQKSDFSYSMERGGGVVLDVSSLLKLKELLCVNNWKTFEELLCLLRKSVLLWSNAVDDIKGIDALLNGNIDKVFVNEVHSSRYTPFALIAARLAGNPNFDELAVSIGTYGAGSGRAWGKFSDAEVAVGWPKLVKYLREEVKPLV